MGPTEKAVPHNCRAGKGSSSCAPPPSFLPCLGAFFSSSSAALQGGSAGDPIPLGPASCLRRPDGLAGPALPPRRGPGVAGPATASTPGGPPRWASCGARNGARRAQPAPREVPVAALRLPRRRVLATSLALLIKSLCLGSLFNARVPILASVSATNERFSTELFNCIFFFFSLFTFLSEDVFFNLLFSLGFVLLFSTAVFLL